jgi:hypothetical protein
MRLIVLLAMVGSSVGCTSALRGAETCTEIHFDETYVLARWAGWPSEDALRIAAANCWTDRHAETNSVATERRVLGGLVNPITVPRILLASVGDLAFQGLPLRRAVGRRVAEATAWAVPPLGHRLHFPAADLDEPVRPAFFVNPATGDLEYGSAEARRVLERAFLDLQTGDDDVPATLALLGIGLHCIQDSYKHRGYSAACGHIGARPDPDQPCGDAQLLLESARATLCSLRYARRLAVGRSSDAPSDWKSRLSSVLAPGGGTTAWAEFVRSDLRDDYPDRSSLLDRWRSQGGEDAFEHALERVREVLR